MMTPTAGHFGIGVHYRAGPVRRLGAGCGARLTGPGGLYNAGNAVGLATGIAMQVAGANSGAAGIGEAAVSAAGYLAGDASAVALTAATVLFFWSGEVYHRAWRSAGMAGRALHRRADILSALGTLILAVVFIGMGQIVLALAVTLLNTGGKLGSAFAWPPLPGWRPDWPDPYRVAVLVSRVPAICVAIHELELLMGRPEAGAPLGDFVTPLSLLVCYVLWAAADLMLLQLRPSTRKSWRWA